MYIDGKVAGCIATVVERGGKTGYFHSCVHSAEQLKM
jgi:hypothetical protein